jgi:hypothetical protein
VIALNERHLKRLLRLLEEYVRYYHEDRTHLGLGKRVSKRPRAGFGQFPLEKLSHVPDSEVCITITSGPLLNGRERHPKDGAEFTSSLLPLRGRIGWNSAKGPLRLAANTTATV